MTKRRSTQRHHRELARQARKYIRGHLADPDLSVADVADAIGCSPRQLQRLFRAEIGEPFRDHLLAVRMELAARLLSGKPPQSVRATARRVGYRGPSGLRQAFVRYHGRNPSEFQPAGPSYVGTEIEPEYR